MLADQPAATLGEIADASGLHRATLHRHFTTREDLLRALYARAAQEAEAAYWAAEPESGAFADALVRVMHAAVQLSDRYRVLLTADDPEFAAHRERASRPLHVLFAHGRDTGVLRRDLPDRWFYLTFRGVLIAAADAIDDDTLSVEEATQAACSTLMSGLGAPA